MSSGSTVHIILCLLQDSFEFDTIVPFEPLALNLKRPCKIVIIENFLLPSSLNRTHVVLPSYNTFLNSEQEN